MFLILISSLLLVTVPVFAEAVKFDRTAPDDIYRRKDLIEKYLPGDTKTLQGKQIRDITYEYFTEKLG